MKKIKSIIALVATLALLCSCGEKNVVSDVSSDSENENVIISPEISENEVIETTAVVHDDEWGGCASYILIPFDIIDGSSVKTILNAVNEAKSHGEQTYGRAEDLKEFYSLDNFLIDGYKLNGITIYSYSIGYNFSPDEPIENPWGRNFIDKENDFCIWIQRLDSEIFYDFNDYVEGFRDSIKFSEERIQEALQSELSTEARDSTIESWERRIKENEDVLNSRAFIEDNIIYNSRNKDITIPFFDTTLGITAPYKLDLDEDKMYEFLRDLAFRVIESAELVTVE